MRSTGAFGYFSLLCLPGCADNGKLLAQEPEGQPAGGNNKPPAGTPGQLSQSEFTSAFFHELPGLDLDVQQGSSRAAWTAKMACQQPRDFRMKANSPGCPGRELNWGPTIASLVLIVEPIHVSFFCSSTIYAQADSLAVPFQKKKKQKTDGMECMGMALPSQWTLQGGVETRFDRCPVIRRRSRQPVQQVVVFDRTTRSTSDSRNMCCGMCRARNFARPNSRMSARRRAVVP